MASEDGGIAALEQAMEMDTEAEDGAHGKKTGAADMQEYYTPIKALSTFIYDWRIKARLVKKSPRKEWKTPYQKATSSI